MVIDDVVDQERIVESAVLRWGEGRGEGRARCVYVLERVPYL